MSISFASSRCNESDLEDPEPFDRYLSSKGTAGHAETTVAAERCQWSDALVLLVINGLPK